MENRSSKVCARAGQHLLLPQIFALNKSETKEIRVGLEVNEIFQFAPIVQIISVRPNRSVISLKREEWQLLYADLKCISDYFDAERVNHQIPIKKFGDLSVKFTRSFDGPSVAFTHGGAQHPIIMMSASISTLKAKAGWIQQWLDMLEILPLEEYRDVLIKSIRSIAMDYMEYNRMPDSEALHGYIISNFEEISKMSIEELKRTIPQKHLGYFYQFFGELFYFHYAELDNIAGGMHRMPSFYKKDEF